MEKSNTTFWVILLLGGVGIFWLWSKSRQQSSVAVSTQVGSAPVRTLNGIMNWSGTELKRVPLVGKYVDTFINAPTQNVLRGDYTAIAGASLTGGFSDYSGDIGIELNPLKWSW